MNGTRRLLITSLLAVIAVAVGSVAVASATDRTVSASSARTLHFRAHILDEATIDLGAPGNSLGDEEIVSGPLLDATGSTRVGSFEGLCVVTSTSPSQGQCALTVRVTGEGQLVSQGHSAIPFVRFTNAVTGGTWNFRGARGEVRGTSLTPALLDLVYRVTA
jgi:hypothetical protein